MRSRGKTNGYTPRRLRRSRPLQLDISTDWSQRLVAIGTPLTILTAVAAIWFGQSADRADAELTRSGQITDRYTAAVGQIASDNPDVVIGGAYALQRIMRDSDVDRAAVINVLSSYIRSHGGVITEDLAMETKEPMRRQPADIQTLMQILADRPDPSRPPFPDLSGADLVGVDLHGMNFAGADLTGADLTFANMRQVNLKGANLELANLKYARLDQADLTDAYAGYAKFEQAVMFSASLTRANMGSADLNDAYLDRADLAGANLSSADMSGASLTMVKLNGADLNEANLHRADLTDAQLKGAVGLVVPPDAIRDAGRFR